MSLAIAPAAWTLHFLLVYALASLACRAGAETLVRPGVAAVTLAALAVYVWLGRGGRGGDGGSELRAFQTRVNRLLAGLATLGTLWVAYPAFVLTPCSP